MPAPTSVSPTTQSDADPTSLRVSFCPPAGHSNRFVDGAWWPRTLDDLTADLPALIAATEAAGYDAIRRINYQGGWWQQRPPRRIRANGHGINLGALPMDKGTLISLIDSSGWMRIDLIVIPPTTEAAVAARVLKLALSEDGLRGPAILALAQTPVAA
jgi:Family of unknown function (DUF5994)